MAHFFVTTVADVADMWYNMRKKTERKDMVL